jgi:hypothetical protein
MSSQAVMSLMGEAEFMLWIVLGLLFWTKKLHRRFPAMWGYLLLHIVSTPILLILFHGQAHHWINGYSFDLYFYSYWAVYIVSAVLLYFICIEVFHSVLSAFAGLQRLGTIVFRWVAVVSAIVSLSTLSIERHHPLILPDIAYKLMRSVSILELCLLGFLCLSMSALRFSERDIAFGISLGMGLISANDLFVNSLLARNTSLTGPLQFVFESLILSTLGIWVAYAAQPEPVRKPVMMPINSTILRWNEIASALGYTGTQVALQQPASGFFLTDVEQAVEKALAGEMDSRNSGT